MEQYFRGAFKRQLASLEYSEPNQVLRKALPLDDTVFFGGRDWANVAQDLSRVPPADRIRFILCLFMSVLNDQALYTCRPDLYAAWRQGTAWPKFGWTGFGLHNENPFKLLWIPEKEGLVDPAELTAAMPAFLEFFVSETSEQLTALDPSLDIADHLKSIMQDGAYAFSEGVTVPAFKAAFEKALAAPEH